MIEYVAVDNYSYRNNLEIPKFYLRNPAETGFAIKNITGIDPGAVSITNTEMALTDGSIFNNARMSTRDIDITFMYFSKTDENSVEILRHKLYKYFPIKKEVKIIFKTGVRETYIIGRVESITSSMFSKESEITVGLLCNDPYFTSNLPVTQENEAARGAFHFPFWNGTELLDQGNWNAKFNSPKLTENTGEINQFYKVVMHGIQTISGIEEEYNEGDFIVREKVDGKLTWVKHDNRDQVGKLLNFGEQDKETYYTFYNEGDVDTGCEIRITASSTVSELQISMANDNKIFDGKKVMKFNIDNFKDGKFIKGDVLTVTTIAGKKSLILSRAGEDYSILNAIDITSTWFQLKQGENNFLFYNTGVISPEFKYYNKFIGV